MFDISALKEMKLTELQEIAKLAKTIKVAGAKDVLIAQILEHQNKTAAQESQSVPETPQAKETKSKRTRITPTPKETDTTSTDLFSQEEAPASVAEEKPAFEQKNKFKKPFERKTTQDKITPLTNQK